MHGMEWNKGKRAKILKYAGMDFHGNAVARGGFHAFFVSSRMSSKAVFNECLQEFIGFYALQVSMLLFLKAF